MAAREGQGLQIAVIIFAMLTILLAITTYIFYAQGQTAMKERDAAQAETGNANALADKYLYRVLALKYVLGMPGVDPQQIDLQKAKSGEDSEVTLARRQQYASKRLGRAATILQPDDHTFVRQLLNRSKLEFDVDGGWHIIGQHR